MISLMEVTQCRLILAAISILQASKDAARYPVAAKVAELLIRGIVSAISCNSAH